MPSGRVTLRTEEVIATIEEAISIGLSNKRAAAAANVGESTFYEWLAQDPGLSDRFECAKARRIVVLEKELRDAGPKEWTKYAWLLERADMAFTKPETRFQMLQYENGNSTEGTGDQAKLVKALEIANGNGKTTS